MIAHGIFHSLFGAAFGVVLGSMIWICTQSPDYFPQIVLLFTFLAFFVGLLKATEFDDEKEDDPDEKKVEPA